MRESKQQVLRLGMMSLAGIAFVGCLSVNAQTAAAEAGYAESVLADKPVGYWRFEEKTASAGAANDAAGDGTKNGVYHNVDLGVPGATAALGSAAGFSGDAAMPSYIDLGSDEALMLRGDLTIEWWQNMTDDPAEDRAVIAWASKGESADTNVLYEMVLRYSEEQKQEKYPRPQFVLGHEYGTGVNVRVPSRTLAQPNRWYHVAVVRDADERSIQYYINGLPAGEPQSYGEGHENPQGGESAGVTIGKLGRFDSRYFQGCLDEVALYDQTLPAERIMAHYRAALDGSSKEHRPQVVAHRGNNRFAPENTLVSYQQALETGAPIVELDLHRSKDGVIVLLHDDTLDRTTNGTGNVNDMTLEQLKALDAGTWKDAKYAGERIPTLEELAELCKGKAVIMLDLKDPVRGDEIAPVLQRVGIDSGQVIVAPWETDQASGLKPYLPDTPMILLHSRIPSEYTTDGDAFFEGLKRMGFSGFSLRWMHLSQAFIDDAHRHGMKIHTWTLNDPEEISGAALMGIDGVITDDPAATAALLSQIRD